jgi:hypothetical protein
MKHPPAHLLQNEWPMSPSATRPKRFGHWGSTRVRTSSAHKPGCSRVRQCVCSALQVRALRLGSRSQPRRELGFAGRRVVELFTSEG